MRVLVAGGDGFCEWPGASYLSARSHESEETVERLLFVALENRDRIHPETFDPKVDWRQPRYT